MWYRRFGLVTALATSLVASPVGAQNPGRELNGHRFLLSGQVPSPFVTSFIRTTTGGGAALNVKTPFIDVDGDTLGTLEGNVGFVLLGFEYQQKVTSWLALRGGFTASARLGTDEQSILAQGVTGILGWGIGGSVLLVTKPTWLVSGGLDFQQNGFVGLVPFRFAQTVIDSGGLTKDNNLVSTTGTVSSRATLRGGWAPRRWLGATGVIEAGVGDIQDLRSKGVYGGAATVGVDFRELGWWPVGVMGFVRYDSFNQNGADLSSSSTRLGMGVLYTGRRDFSIGLEGSTISFTPQGDVGDFSGWAVVFNLRYWLSGG